MICLVHSIRLLLKMWLSVSCTNQNNNSQQQVLSWVVIFRCRKITASRVTDNKNCHIMVPERYCSMQYHHSVTGIITTGWLATDLYTNVSNIYVTNQLQGLMTGCGQYIHPNHYLLLQLPHIIITTSQLSNDSILFLAD